MPTKKLVTYVALLRGINVGGNTIIKMALLKEIFEKAGMKNVKTYINSGNVIFRAPKAESAKLAAKLEKAIKTSYKAPIRMLVRSLGEYEKMLKGFPKGWGSNAKQRHYVSFVWPALDRKSAVAELDGNPEFEKAWHSPGAILWSTDLDAITRSRIARNALKPKYYQDMTIRNANTTRKLHALLLETDKLP